MTDYYPLIAKAVAGLEKNTGDQRRALYERARSALVAQLRGLEPPLTESEITRERLGLEEAIRKVEAEAARKTRFEPQRVEPVLPPRPAGPLRDDPPRAALEPTASPPPEPPVRAGAKETGDPRSAETSTRAANAKGGRERPPPLSDEGLRGFRDVVAEAETLGEATAQAVRSAREAYAAVPTNDPELDRIEPRVEPMGLRTP